jgi:hypothetical protein
MRKIVCASSVCLLMTVGVQAAFINNTFNPATGDWNTAANWSQGWVPGQRTGTEQDRAIVNAGRVANVNSAAPAPNLAYDITVGNNADGGTVNISANMSGINIIRIAGALSANGDMLQTAGTVSASGVAVGFATAAGGLYKISGGALTVGSGDIQILNSGTLSLQGSTATISSSDLFTMTGAGKLEFVLGTTGVNAISVANAFTVDSANSLLVINGSGYTGGATNITLVNAATMTGSFASGKYIVTGLGLENTGWKLIQGTNGDVVLNVIPEPATIGMLGLGAIITLLVRGMSIA